MKRESIVFLVSGTVFGLFMGVILGDRWAVGRRAAPPPTTTTAAAESGNAGAAVGPRAVDEARVRDLTAAAEQNASDAVPRIALGNLYFDAERFEDAITWYEAALELDSRNVDARTDLGVSYYYTNQPDRALEQFDYSLSIDPRHTKTMLNMGIVRAFGKQDLLGASAAWEQVVAIAPESPEGRAARQALDSMNAAHPGADASGAVPPDDGEA